MRPPPAFAAPLRPPTLRRVRPSAPLGCGGLLLAFGMSPGLAADAPPGRLQEVVVTATPLRKPALESVQPVTLRGGDDLVRVRAPSLGETLADLPGLSATAFGPQASRPVIRGLGGDRVQMFQDGGDALDVSALSDDHAVTIESLLAERIEVVRGPATLAWGSTASAGLVNVITGRIPRRRDAPPFGASLEVRGDQASGERAVAARADGRRGAWQFHGDLHRRSTDDLQIPGFAQSDALRAALEAAGETPDDGRGRLANSAADSRGGAGGLSWVGDAGHVGLAVSRYDAGYGIPGDEAVRIDMDQTRYDLEGEWRAPLAAIEALRLRASWNDYAHAEIEPEGEVGTQFDQRGREARLSAEHRPLAGWRGVLGLQWRDVDLVAAGEEAFVPPSRTRNLGAWLVEERRFGAVVLEGGLRLERQQVEADTAQPDYDDQALSASAGVLWSAPGGAGVALNLTSTERHPTATELFADGPHLAVQRFEIGDASLGLERSRTADLALRLARGGWRGEVSAFVSDYSGFIFPRLAGTFEDGLPVVQFDATEARFTGLELQLEAPALDTAAGRLSARLFGDLVRAEDGDGDPLPLIPPRRLGAGLGLERGTLRLGVDAIWHDAQRRLAANELPTDGFTLLSADLAWRVPAWGRGMLLFVRGSNLLDEDARRHASPLKDRAPLAGRSVSAGVRLDF
jgi:iron complex outermembrane receptor protein